MSENTSVKMRTINVAAHPYADTDGTIEVPEGLTPAEIRDYVDNHFDKVKFGAPRFDYRGTDYELYDENGDDIEEDEE